MSNERVKSIIDTIKNTVYNKYKYHVIVVKDSNIMVTKADLNYGNKLMLDDLNNKYIEAYEKVSSGMNAVSNNNEDDDSDDNNQNANQLSDNINLDANSEENRLNDIIEL